MTGSDAAAPRALAATVLLFATNGMVAATYAACLPALRVRLGIDELGITGMLLGLGIGAITGMQLSGRLCERWGNRRVALLGLPVLAVAAVLLGLAPTYGWALAGVLVLGLGNGVVDIAMNAIAVQVERALERPVMSGIHATWSLGQLGGAALVLLVGTLVGGGTGLVTAAHLVAAAIVVGSWLVCLRLVPDVRTPPLTAPDGSIAAVPRAAYVMGVMAIAFGLAEGAALDWSALHVTDVARVPESVGAAGVAAVSGFMVVVRLLGDLLVVRLGRRRTVRLGGVVAAAGFAAVTVVSLFPLVVAGWCLVGFGVGLIAPQVYAAAGHLGGARALAVTVTFGYAAVFIGPAAMGFAVRTVGIQHAMVLPALLCAAVPLLAVVMPRDDALLRTDAG